MLSRLLLLQQQLSPAASSAAAGAAVGSRGLLQSLARGFSATATAEQDQALPLQPQADQPADQLQQQQQQQGRSRPRLLRQQPCAVPVTSPQAAQPLLPAPMILKTLLVADRPLTSHELWAAVHRDYGYRIPTRSQFKAHIKGLFRARLVRAVSPAAAGAKGGGKGKAGEPFVYVVTDAGREVDLNEGGSRLHAKARVLADAWTAQQLPQYRQHLAEGRVPLTPDNEGLLSAEEKQRLLQQWQLKQAKHQARTQAITDAWQQQLQALQKERTRKPQQTKQQQQQQKQKRRG